MMLSDSFSEKAREIAHEIIDARTDIELAEGVRAFLSVCRRYRVLARPNPHHISVALSRSQERSSEARAEGWT